MRAAYDGRSTRAVVRRLGGFRRQRRVRKLGYGATAVVIKLVFASGCRAKGTSATESRRYSFRQDFSTARCVGSENYVACSRSCRDYHGLARLEDRRRKALRPWNDWDLGAEENREGCLQ